MQRAVGEKCEREKKRKRRIPQFSNNEKWGTQRPRVCWRRRGERVELQFVLKAVSLGFGVARPFGDTQAYDVIVEAEGRLWRVQVKSTDCRYRGGYALAVSHSRGSTRRPYEESEIDLLAGYVIPEDVWYLIPVKKARKQRLVYLFPNGTVTGDQAKYEKYREKWEVLGKPSGVFTTETRRHGERHF